jgi:hypothetical protein
MLLEQLPERQCKGEYADAVGMALYCAFVRTYPNHCGFLAALSKGLSVLKRS